MYSILIGTSQSAVEIFLKRVQTLKMIGLNFDLSASTDYYKHKWWCLYYRYHPHLRPIGLLELMTEQVHSISPMPILNAENESNFEGNNSGESMENVKSLIL